MTVAAVGDVVLYQTTQMERDDQGITTTEWPAIVIISHADGVATLHVLTETGYSPVKPSCVEDNAAPYDEGTWRPKP